MCSTPYGIKGLITVDVGSDFLFGFVLNALRHQRFNHCFKSRNSSRTPMCSTPYGIKGLITGNGVQLVTASPRAQRLTASKV